MDADLEQLSRKHTSDSNSKSEHSSVVNATEKFSNGDSGEKCDESAAQEGEVTQSSGETPVAESEQATYASANNDLKGTKAYQEADVPGLYNLAMAIIDYRGHRVVAQVCIEDAAISSNLHTISVKMC